MKEKTKIKKVIQVLITIIVIILIILCIGYMIYKHVDLDSLFKNTTVNNYTTEKEVIVSDEGIADAVDLVYNATVIVKIYEKNQLAGWGSGFVYKTDDKYGYILTNAHVVEDATSLKITYTDETETDGECLGYDTYSDVAVVRVPVDTVKAVAKIGSSSNLRVGDTVFAVGTPISLEYSFTVTRGILSGTNRIVSMSSSSSTSYGNSESWYMSLLQIDASINSGNSGGPLSNASGEVVGITNSKLSSSYSYYSSSANIENMGFAIPIEDALSVAEQLESTGKVTRPYLGVSMTTIAGASYNGITLDSSITSGVVIVDVDKGSCADDAGLKKGDVITKFGDYEVSDYKYLKYYLYRYNVGDTVDVTYIRNGKTSTTKITLSK